MTESGHYPIGSEHDPKAPWNQETSDSVVKVELHLIPIWIDDEQEEVAFKLQIEELDEEVIVKIIDNYAFHGNWEEDITFHLQRIYDKEIKLTIKS